MRITIEQAEKIRDNWDIIKDLVLEYEANSHQLDDNEALLKSYDEKYRYTNGVVEDINELIKSLQHNDEINKLRNTTRSISITLRKQMQEIAAELHRYVPQGVTFKLDETTYFTLKHDSMSSNLYVQFTYPKKS